MAILEVLQEIQDSSVAMDFLGSQYLYPLVESAHVLGLAFSVGLLAIADLRLLGAVMRKQPAADSLETLRPWMLTGFAVMFVTGLILFLANAAKLWVNPLFQLKMLFVALAGANALYFELRLGRLAHTWADPLRPPVAARVAGGASLAFWALVILYGRWIAYGS